MTRWSLFLQTLPLLHHFLGLYSVRTADISAQTARSRVYQQVAVSGRARAGVSRLPAGLKGADRGADGRVMERDPHADFRRCRRPGLRKLSSLPRGAPSLGVEVGRERLEAEIRARLAGPPHPVICGCAPCKLVLTVKVRLAQEPPLWTRPKLPRKPPVHLNGW